MYVRKRPGSEGGVPGCLSLLMSRSGQGLQKVLMPFWHYFMEGYIFRFFVFDDCCSACYLVI